MPDPRPQAVKALLERAELYGWDVREEWAVRWTFTDPALPPYTSSWWGARDSAGVVAAEDAGEGVSTATVIRRHVITTPAEEVTGNG